jgi:hypothetical protein
MTKPDIAYMQNRYAHLFMICEGKSLPWPCKLYDYADSSKEGTTTSGNDVIVYYCGQGTGINL